MTVASLEKWEAVCVLAVDTTGLADAQRVGHQGKRGLQGSQWCCHLPRGRAEAGETRGKGGLHTEQVCASFSCQLSYTLGILGMELRAKNQERVEKGMYVFIGVMHSFNS